jgi:uncharacterized damage-inducible protein DinB
MQLSQWFYQQIRASTEGFCWAVEQIPQERYYLSPKPGKWSVGRIIYHMVCYDQLIGRPTLRQWIGEPLSLTGLTGDQEKDAAIEEENWKNGEGHEVQVMLTDFHKLRTDQLAFLQQFLESTWSEERDAIWGPVTLKWAVTKTYQHTLEHTDEILRSYLWWK